MRKKTKYKTNKEQKSMETIGFGVLWGKTYKKLSKNFHRAIY